MMFFVLGSVDSRLRSVPKLRPFSANAAPNPSFPPRAFTPYRVQPMFLGIFYLNSMGGSFCLVFTGQDPACGLDHNVQNITGRVRLRQEVVGTRRVGSGRVGSGRVGSGRVESHRDGLDQEKVSKSHGSCHSNLARPAGSDPIHEKPCFFCHSNIGWFVVKNLGVVLKTLPQRTHT